MKRFIVMILSVSVFFIGLGGIIQRATAKFKSDEKMLIKKNIRKFVLTMFLLGFFYGGGYAQNFRPSALPAVQFPARKSFVEVPFEVSLNHIIIPVSVNGSRPLRFVLDTGAQGAILYNSALADSLNLKITGKMQVRGAGMGANSEVSVAEGAEFNIGGLVLSNGHIAVRSSRSGSTFMTDRDGVIGRPVFANVVVEVDWEQRRVRFYDSAKFNYSGKGAVLPLTFDEGGRPYAMANVRLLDNTAIPVKLVVDTGATSSLSLDTGSRPEIKYPEGAAKVVLGRGGNGDITGYSGRVKALQLGDYTIEDIPTGFPDASQGTAGIGGRHGRLGAGVLRRFKVIYDYSRKRMILEPNRFLNNSFGSFQNIGSTTIQVSPEKLQDYVGKYGNKEISIKDGGLYYQRIGGLGAALRAIAQDKFALNTDAQITFFRDSNGIVTEMLVEWAELDNERLKRESPEINQPNNPPQTSVVNSLVTDDSAITQELTTHLEKLSAEDAFSGVVLIAKNSQPIFSKAYGLADKTTGAPNNLDTKFNIASMNKMFTAVAIAQLVESGKLSFDDTIGKLLPDYPNKVVAEKVTIHQLLTHTSGMGNYQNEKFFAQLDKMKTVGDLLPLFVDEQLAYEPGAKWQYSNAGFAVLGLVIEKVSGQNYFEYVQENIFKPAGMNDTDSYEKGANVSNLAIGYTRMNPNGQPDPNAPRRENTPTRPFKGSSAGGGYSTANDLLKFALALQNNKLLSKKFTDIVTTGKFDVGGPMGKYAYGFGDKIFSGKRIVGHNGGAPGIGANFDMFPELGYTAIVLSNYDSPVTIPLIMKIRGLIPAAQSPVLEQLQKPQVQQQLSQAEQEVRKLEREWLDAYEKRDAEAMNRIVADDFKLTRSDGSVQTKANILAELKNAPNTSRPAVKLSTENVQSRVEGDTVIRTGIFTMRMERDGQTRMMQARYNDTYVKRDGRWQVVASQLSRNAP